MITGLREFRKKLSEYMALVKKGQIVIITDRDRSIASLVSIDKLRELAKKADDKFIISQLVEAQTDKNKEFLERREFLKKMVKEYIGEARKEKRRVPNSVIEKLKAIFSAIESLTSSDGTLEDQRMLSLLRHKSYDPISRILDHDYYHVHKDFITKVKGEMQKMVEKVSESPKTSSSIDMKLLADILNQAIIREKTKFDDRPRRSAFSVLVRLTKKGKYYTSRIYTVVPQWYERKRNTKYFIEGLSPLGMRIRGKKIGDVFKYQGYQFKILSIT